MPNLTTDIDLELRLERLTRRIEEIKAEVARGLEPESIAHMLALGDILHRHGTLAAAMRKVRTTVGRRAVLAEFAADLKGMEEALRGWIARLDGKPRH